MRGLTSGCPETTRDTVDMATPARSATCRMLGLRLVLSLSSLSCRKAQYSYLRACDLCHKGGDRSADVSPAAPCPRAGKMPALQPFTDGATMPVLRSPRATDHGTGWYRT